MTNAQSPVPGPWTPERVRMLKIAVTIMTTLLIVGIIALVYGVARQAAKLSSGPASPARPVLSSPAAAPSATPYAQTLALGQGELKSVSADNGSVILHYKGENSDTIVVLDPQNGQERGRFQVPRR
ncbi:hypothetical protein KKP04_13355 [Rhodomicrobium sp. Az07]|uniref:hypothetical protein n=1 Tax=Rhodomicrobium sp. Az07 TaxID=2839034 RepID=UPI001BEC929A|nr:hypothetical protein [Rhodomicrobium sp. Az07]MBT3071854.1 hypothetical protein [Rhodomicrobium sp. Az07]